MIRASSGQPVPPTLASNTQLTGLAQSGVLKLRCDRAFVSLLGTNTQYVIAEATKSISLRQTNRYATPQDALLLGVQAVDKSYGVCPNTVSVFTDATGNLAVDNSQVLSNTTRYIIRDFRELDNFKDRPYVAGFPYMRSYAEVPLRSSNGRVVGSYCVVDNVVRDDFFDDETVFVLDEVADSIMGYLDIAAVKHNHARGERLMQGLACFTEGKSSLDIQSDAQLIRQAQVYAARPSTLAHQHQSIESDDMSYSTGLTPSLVSDVERGRLSDSGSDAYSSNTSHTSVSGLQQSSALAPPSGSSSVFSRAANIMREALELDGVALIDLSTEGNESVFQASGIGTTPRGPRSQAAASVSVEPDVFEGEATAALCNMLGISFAGPPLSGGIPLPLPSLPSFRSSSLYFLAKTYPEGQIFSIDEYGIFPVDSALRRGSTSSELSDRNGFDSNCLPSELQTEFTGARCVAFKPLWDFSKETLVAGIIGWTTDITRFLDTDDLTCLDAFGHALMTEVARSEAVYIASAKSAFISSISHELRSPLHGILASAELLHQSVKEDSEKDLVRMVENCGTTLLDTLNHLLEYSKVNGFESIKEASPLISPDQSSHGQTTETLLCQLVQDVVESVHFGQGFALSLEDKHDPSETALPTSLRQFPSASTSGAVGVFVDIEHRPDWFMPLHVGASKRVIMNLFANAMKYTSAGHITISLKIVPIEDKHGQVRKHSRLVVGDSGVGMSQRFLDNDLFKPFVQEDVQRPGTGLGLSIVKRIVEDMKGTISVQSRQGYGTTITVLIPLLDLPLSCATSEKSARDVLDPAGVLQNRTICVVSNPQQSTADTATRDTNRFSAMKSVVTGIARDWLGMTVVSSSSLDKEADFYVVDGPAFANDIASLSPKPDDRTTKTILSIGATSSSRQTISINASVTPMPYPITPRLLAKALLAASKRREEDLKRDQHSSSFEESNSDAVDDTVQHAVTSIVTEELPLSSAVEKGTLEQNNKKHLLLVDDNPINLKVLSISVKKLGCTWETASNGLEAVNIYKSSKKRFDIVFMDLSMPVLDGFGASSAIRNYEKTSAEHSSQPTRIIALTGLGAESSKREAEASGIDEFRTKPIKMGDIQRLIDGL